MTNIYDQHRAAFAKTSAYVIMKDGELVAKVNFKFPADGAGRLYCYLHVVGLPMVRDFAGGCGYDKRSAAFAAAAEKQTKVKLESWQKVEDYFEQLENAAAIFAAVSGYDGRDWDDSLRVAGFVVINAL